MLHYSYNEEPPKTLSRSLRPLQWFSKTRVPFRALFIRVPYYLGDLDGDTNLENYQCTLKPIRV